MTLGVGLLGAGRIARVHSAVLASGVVQGVHLVGVCDTQPARAAALSLERGVPAFANLRDMLGRCVGLDAVAVLTESGNHVPHALEVLSAATHAIIEKPASLTAEGTRALILRERPTARVAVVHQNRFNLPVAALERALEDRALGDVVQVAAQVFWGRTREYYAADPWRGTRMLDGGALGNQGVHHLDILVHLFGKVDSIAALARRNRHDIECEDTTTVLLGFASGVQGVLLVTTATGSDYEGSLTVVGTEGYVRIGGECLNRIERWHTGTPAPACSASVDYASLGIPSLYGYGHVSFYEDFVNSVNSGRSFKCTLEQAHATVEVLEAIYDIIADRIT